METDTDIQEGDIFVSVWGYIDKIVDFYKVTKRTPRTVTIRKLKAKVIEEVHRDGPAGSNLVVPSDEFEDTDEIRKKIQDDGMLILTSYSWAIKWDGKPVKEVFGYY